MFPEAETYVLRQGNIRFPCEKHRKRLEELLTPSRRFQLIRNTEKSPLITERNPTRTREQKPVYKKQYLQDG